MTVTVVTAPADLVTAANAKAWQPVFAADEDARVTALLQAAQSAIEPPNSWVGRAFGVQTLEARRYDWPTRDLRLPFPPLRSVTSVKYDDVNGVEQTLDPSLYMVFGGSSSQSGIILKSGASWPALASRADAIRVRFVAGYDAGDPQLLPVKQAIVLAASHLRSLGTQDLALRTREIEGVGSRTWTVSDAAQKIIASTVEALLHPFRVYS